MPKVSLYEFDVYHDIRESYQTFRKKKSVMDAVNELIAESQCMIEDDDDGPVFWISVARAQMIKKELLDSVADKAFVALQELESRYDLRKGEADKFRAALKDPARRIDADAALKTPVPKKKRYYRCPWKIGDVYALRLNGPAAIAHGLDGGWLLLRKISEQADFPYEGEATIPVLYWILWRKDTLPQTVEELETAGFLRATYDEVYPYTHVAYRIMLMISSKREVAKAGLVYVGNFMTAGIPKDEVSFERVQRLKYANFKYLEAHACAVYRHGGMLFPELVPYDTPVYEL